MSCSTTAGAAWAIPVSITRLGAHLQAHLDTKPAINSLRLCHRFGQGEHVVITKVPQEILELIINEFLHGVRKRCLTAWNKDFRCFEDRCFFQDHISWIRNLRDTPEPPEWTDESESEEKFEATYEKHDSIRDEWEGRVCQHQGMGRFTPCDRILRTDFGLEAFIAHQRIPKDAEPYLDYKARSYRDFHNTTLAYLTLPSRFNSEEYDDADCMEYSGQAFDFISTMGIPIDLEMLRLSKEEESRFERAMRILDLDVTVHLLQVPNLLTSPELTRKPLSRMRLFKSNFEKLSKAEKKDEKKKMRALSQDLQKGEWPKLLTL